MAVLVVPALSLVCAGTTWGATTYSPSKDINSMLNTTAYTGAQEWWTAGYTGQGVDVAVIDTGVNPVPGLNGSGKILYGPDLSFESQASNLRNLDTNGHGTFMAGLIAAKDEAGTASARYKGMAPDARIVSVKVGAADGAVDVSQVIAAIDWVVQHKNDSGLNIRVINLSYGTNSAQSWSVDPLSYAVEQAWKKGIVVVAAAGNSGYQMGSNGGLAAPAYNPYVIAVGGSDSNSTTSISDDTVGSYSASGNCGGCRAPDYLAPGSHLQGLRVVNSYLDVTHPEGVLDARFFRGSGTSQSAAIVSGAVALVLSKYPNLNPDQVKGLFVANASRLSKVLSMAQGAGILQLAPMLMATPANYVQSFTAGTGTGSLELARGTDHLTHNGVTLTGEKDIFGRPFDSASMAQLEAAGSSWSGGVWNGSTWSGSTWSGSTWSGSTWSGSTWSGNTWSGNSWSGNTWSGGSWMGATWG